MLMLVIFVLVLTFESFMGSWGRCAAVLGGLWFVGRLGWSNGAEVEAGGGWDYGGGKKHKSVPLTTMGEEKEKQGEEHVVAVEEAEVVMVS